MKSAFLLLLSMFCGGCALTPDQAVAIATREIQQRHLSLPTKYATAVNASRYYEADKDYWDVSFMTTDSKKRLYEVSVNQYSHCVEEVRDEAQFRPATY